jgi:hypothetical protein
MLPIVVAVLIVLLLAMQLLVGYGVLGPSAGHPGFRRIHGILAAALGVAFVAHDAVPLLWLKRPALMLKAAIVLPAGLVVLALFVLVVLVGFRVLPLHRRNRVVHVALAWAIVAVGLLHGVAVLSGIGTTPMSPPCTTCHRPPAAHPPISCEACHRHPGIAW